MAILILGLPQAGFAQTLSESIKKTLEGVQPSYLVESDQRALKQLEEDYPNTNERERFINEFAMSRNLTNLSRSEKIKAAGQYNLNQSPRAACRAFEKISTTVKANPNQFESSMSASGASGAVALTAKKILFRERAAIEAARITAAISSVVEKAGFRQEFIRYHGYYGIDADMTLNWNEYMRKPLDVLKRTLPQELEKMGIDPRAAAEITAKMGSMSGGEAHALLEEVLQSKKISQSAINMTAMSTDRNIAVWKAADKGGFDLIGGKAYEVSDEFAKSWANKAVNAAIESEGKLAQEIVRSALLSTVEKTAMEEGSRRAARAAAGKVALKVITRGAGKWILEGAIPVVGWAMIGSDIAHAAAPEVANSDLYFREQNDVSMFFSGTWDQAKFCNSPISEGARAEIIAVSRAIENGEYIQKNDKVKLSDNPRGAR